MAAGAVAHATGMSRVVGGTLPPSIIADVETGTPSSDMGRGYTPAK